ADGNRVANLPFHFEVERYVLLAAADSLIGRRAEVAVYRYRVDMLVAQVEHLPVPLKISRQSGPTRAAGREKHGGVYGSHTSGCVRRLPAVLLGAHVTDLPRTVELIAEPPVVHAVGLWMPVLATQVAPSRAAGQIAVFHERRGLRRAAAAEIHCHQRLGTAGFAPGHELVRAEAVALDRVPCLIEHPRPPRHGSDAVEPVVLRKEAPSGTADQRHAEGAHHRKNIAAESVRTRKRRARLINAVVNCAAKMLEKRAKDRPLKWSDRPTGVHVNPRWLLRRHRCARCETATQDACRHSKARNGCTLQKTASGRREHRSQLQSAGT